MKIIHLGVGQLGTNCYIAYCEKTLQAGVIDPGGSPEAILAEINKAKLKVEYIINTHGHADHIGANDAIQQATGAKVLIHYEDAGMLTSAQLNLSMYIGGGFVCQPPDRLLNDGDMISIGNIDFKVLHTPGHTPGGICLLADAEKVLFAGDTLFAESIGRTDFPGGSSSQLINGIKNKLLILDDDIKVLPGHGPETSIGWERKRNPFIQ
ncbi:MBL fold metallo-hydrolase [Sporomusa acidovorans]|uniref:Hydroxyacylglutathione hydrolase GloC n=1 Tax=Sporomusa acidovorans (strain ATCC 49682 / DSM 3132 / Mol) TaxID=1123286 RepID=A0ABZ3J4Q3_SPOA4|nr:MBL fold metallo-hydrolase [Sporomusa acidovorans]OZC20877.1 putative metallo-hydrolase [Sporomusa acidovorans DSM 3132]SDE59905.1 Glyoxylase, beta-lactamase superfamily II [Sporomusa acidovorans]